MADTTDLTQQKAPKPTQNTNNNKALLPTSLACRPTFSDDDPLYDLQLRQKGCMEPSTKNKGSDIGGVLQGRVSEKEITDPQLQLAIKYQKIASKTDKGQPIKFDHSPEGREGARSLIHDTGQVWNVKYRPNVNGQLSLEGLVRPTVGSCSGGAIVDAAIASGPRAVNALIDDLDKSVAGIMRNIKGRFPNDTLSEKILHDGLREMKKEVNQGTLTSENAVSLKRLTHERLLDYTGTIAKLARGAVSSFAPAAEDMVFPGTLRSYLQDENSQLGKELSRTGQKIILVARDESVGQKPSSIPNHYIADLNLGNGNHLISGATHIPVPGDLGKALAITRKTGINITPISDDFVP